MNLSPTELERLTIFTAAEFARRNIRSGIPLSHPEAVAFITDEAMLMARAGGSYTEIRHLSTRLLTPAELEPGVPLSMPSERALSSRPLIVTKAGAFGDDRTLQRVRATLRGGSIHLTSYR